MKRLGRLIFWAILDPILRKSSLWRSFAWCGPTVRGTRKGWQIGRQSARTCRSADDDSLKKRKSSSIPLYTLDRTDQLCYSWLESLNQFISNWALFFLNGYPGLTNEMLVWPSMPIITAVNDRLFMIIIYYPQQKPKDNNGSGDATDVGKGSRRLWLLRGTFRSTYLFPIDRFFAMRGIALI